MSCRLTGCHAGQQSPYHDTASVRRLMRHYMVAHARVHHPPGKPLKEYMQLNAAGFTLLETKVTWSMAMTMATVLLPSMAKHLLAGHDLQMAPWSPMWTLTSTVMVVACMVCLADSAKCVAVSRGHFAVMARLQKHASNICSVLHRQKALLVVVVALTVHTTQYSSQLVHKDEL